MATIVEHHGTKQRFVLIGAGFGMYKSSRPHVFWGDWAQHEDGAPKNSSASVASMVRLVG